MVVRAEVDAERRRGAMRHHTGTHLLHAALRETLGPHVKQAGSLVAPDRLRFDFSHYAPVGPRELRHIENRVNGEILRGARVEQKVMGREEALAYGALAFFGDKYGERVRVVEVPGFSKEFCGGTHVAQTGEIGLFLFTAEQGISAGTRRVEALAGEAAIERAQADQGILEELEQSARVDRRELVDEYARLRELLKARDREIQGLRMKLATAGAGGGAEGDQVEVAGTLVWTPRFEGLDRKAHAAVVDDFRNRNKDRRFALVSTLLAEDGVSVIAAVSPRLAAVAEGAGDHEAPRPAGRRPARLRPGRRGRARGRRGAAEQGARAAPRRRGSGTPWLGRGGLSSGRDRPRSCWRSWRLASASTVQAQVYTRRNANGVVEATNVPDSPGFNLTYPGKGTLIHSRGFQRTRAYWSMYDHHVQEAAQLHQVSPDLVKSVIAVESEFDQWAVSSKGARGLMQLMPATARRLGVADSFDARQNIFAGTQYLRMMLDQFGGDVDLALAAYNAGPGAVTRYGGVPPYRETRGYVQKVQGLLGSPAPPRRRRGRLLRALHHLRSRSARPRRRRPPRRVEPARPRTYYRWRDERGVTHVAEAPPPEGTVYSTVRALD
jgi:hypothetical protein